LTKAFLLQAWYTTVLSIKVTMERTTKTTQAVNKHDPALAGGLD